MTLGDWIIKTGPKKVANLTGMDPSTVSSWRNYETVPRPKTMVLIHKLTKGKVSYRTIIETFVAKNK